MTSGDSRRSSWVPAHCYNYVDIFANKKNRGDVPSQVLENPLLTGQRTLPLRTLKQEEKKKRREQKQKKRSSHYDELCLQYQYAQNWLSKRNAQVSVRLTKSELKQFMKWFDSRMVDSNYGKDDGIDVEKVSKEFVKHGIFEDELEAADFLAKVDSDKNGALSYHEFKEGVEKVNDYLQVMLLKKFIHSLQMNEYKRRVSVMKDADKFHYLSSGKATQKTVLNDDEPETVDDKDRARKNEKSEKKSSDMMLNSVVKIPLAGGGMMFAHSSNKRAVDSSEGNTTQRKDQLEELRSSAQILNSNSIRRNSVFVAPGSDLIEHQNRLRQMKPPEDPEKKGTVKKPNLRDKFSKSRMRSQRSFKLLNGNNARAAGGSSTLENKDKGGRVSWADAAAKVTTQKSQRKLMRGASARTFESPNPVKLIVNRMNSATSADGSAPRRPMSALPLPLRREKTSLGFML